MAQRAARRPLHLSAFVMDTVSHIYEGTWRHPDAQQHRFNELQFWTDLAKQLEDGGFDDIFLADVIGLYGQYAGSHAVFAKHGLQIPSNDPLSILSALAAATDRIGLAFTNSIIQDPPFTFARRVSTLDHASNGRIAWNIVTGTNANGYRNLNYNDLVAHDSRYDLAEEYVTVAYKLWEGSWDEDSVPSDRAAGVYADPRHIHYIRHLSEHYSVEGPHLVQPSPQRTPVLFQAGSSPAGRAFAAKNAEAQFIVAPNPAAARKTIDETNRLLSDYGRAKGDLKYFQGLSFVVGGTEAEAVAKGREIDEFIDDAAQIAHFGGGMGIDFGEYNLDEPLENLQVEGARSFLDWLRDAVPGRTPTLRDVAKFQARTSRITGTPEQIADRLQEWQDAGIDGINVINAHLPGSYTDFIAGVIPELRKRGLADDGPQPGQTFRQRLFGRDRLPENHPAATQRGAFNDPIDAG